MNETDLSRCFTCTKQELAVLLNPIKAKLLCYHVDAPDNVYVALENTTVRTSLHGQHFGNFISII